jgi:hypothetical protein
MSDQNTLKKILSYLKLQTGIPLKELKQKPIKTKSQFLQNYKRHDRATKSIALTYFRYNFSLHPIGKDLRDKKVFLNREVPDYYVEKIVDSESNICFCFDVKSKSIKDYYGWVNERSVNHYRKFSKMCKVKVFVIFLIIDDYSITRDFAYSNIFQNKKSSHISWDKNRVYVLPYQKGLPFLRKPPNKIGL